MVQSNDVIAWNERLFRVLAVLPGQVLLYDLSSKSKASINFESYPLSQIADAEQKSELKSVDDPFAELRQRKLTDTALKKLEQNYELIKPIVENQSLLFDREKYKQALKELALHGRSTVRQAYRLLARWYRCGMCRNALIPDYRLTGKHKMFTKSPGRRNRLGTPIPIFNEQLKNLFDSIIRRYVLIPKGTSLRKAYAYLLTEYSEKYGEEAPLPSFGQFINFYYRHYDRRERNLAKNKSHVFDKDVKSHLGSVYDIVHFAGQVYEIDSTPDNVYLASSRDRTMPVGRPVLYVVSDLYTGMIVGFSVSFENAQYKSAAEALFCAISPKKKYFKDLFNINLDFDWDVAGLPAEICADNAELEGTHIEVFAKKYGVTICNTPPRRADMKGTVENGQGLIQNELRFLLRNVAPDKISLKKAGAEDHRTDAYLTLDEYRLLVLHTVNIVNNRLRAKLPPDYPFNKPHKVSDVWQWARNSGRNKLGRVKDEASLKTALMPRYEASVSRNGICLNIGSGCSVRYTCPELDAQGWFDRDQDSKKIYKPQVCINTGNMAQAFVYPNPKDKSEIYYACTPASGYEYLSGLTLHEARLAQQMMNAERLKSTTESDHIRSQEYKKLHKINSEAFDKTKSAVLSKELQISNNEKLSLIKVNRIHEQIEQEKRQGKVTANIIEPASAAEPAETDEDLLDYSDDIIAAFSKNKG